MVTALMSVKIQEWRRPLVRPGRCGYITDVAAYNFGWPAPVDPSQKGTTPVSSSIHYLLDTLLWLFLIAVIISVILSWLVQFGVINRSNPIVNQLGESLHRLTEPALRPIRNVLPDLGGIDISPIILIVGIEFVRRLLASALL